MKKLITACAGLLMISGCALTKPSANEIASTYQASINSQDKELVQEWTANNCAEVINKKAMEKISCHLVGDVLVYDIRLTDNRWQWSPPAATLVTKDVLTYFCNNAGSRKVLQSGFAVLVNLQGSNGFAGKLKTYEDCNALLLGQNKG